MPKKKPAPDLSLPTVIEKLGNVIVLDIELVNGNEGRGGDWYESNNRKRKLLKIFRAKELVFRPLDYPVKVRLTRLIGKGQRYWDSMSVLSGSAKELFDAMVECDWFVNDDHNWIKLTVSHQELRRDKPPGFRLEIFQLDEPIVM